MPVLFSIGRVDDVPGAELDGLLAADLHKSAAFGDMEGLASAVGVPGGARAGGEPHGGHVELFSGAWQVVGAWLPAASRAA